MNIKWKRKVNSMSIAKTHMTKMQFKKKKKHHWVSETKGTKSTRMMQRELVWVLHNGRSPSCSNQWSCSGPRVCIWAGMIIGKPMLPSWKDGSWWNVFLFTCWGVFLHPPKSRNQTRRENAPPNQIPRVSRMLRLWFDSCNWTHDPGQCLSSSDIFAMEKERNPNPKSSW